jgi:hypothetical protein
MSSKNPFHNIQFISSQAPITSMYTTSPQVPSSHSLILTNKSNPPQFAFHLRKVFRTGLFIRLMRLLELKESLTILPELPGILDAEAVLEDLADLLEGEA